MKIALYIENGLEQIVLTPENDTESDILARAHDGSRTISLKTGSFYDCQGGWTRHRHDQFGMEKDTSTIIVLREVKS